MDLAARMLRGVGASPVAPFLERVFERLRALPAGRRRALVPSPGGAVGVVTAAPLCEPDRQRCRRDLAALLGVEPGIEPEVEFGEEPALVGGVELRFPFEILRCTWREELAGARAELVAAGEEPAGPREEPAGPREEAVAP